MKTAQLPAKWRAASMADIAADRPNSLVIGPFGSDLKTSDFVDSGVPVVFVRNVRPNGFNPGDQRFVSDEKAEQLAAHAVNPGDLVVTKMGLPPCVTAIYPIGAPRGIVTADIIRLSPNCEEVDPRYVSYYLNSSPAKDQVARFTFGVTRPKVTLTAFRSLEIPLPPLPEQKRIADILDKADAIRRKRQEANQAAAMFMHAVFADLFNDGIRSCVAGRASRGWTSTTIDGIKADKKYSCIGGPFGSDLTAADYVSKAGVPVIRGGNLPNDGPFMSEDNFVFVSEEKAEQLSKCSAFRGDVIVSQRGARLAGQVGIISSGSPYNRFIVSQSQMKVSVDRKKLDPFILVCYLQSAWAVREMENRTISTGVPHINLGILKSFPVHLPPINLQNTFMQAWAAQQSLTQSTQVASRESEDLFTSLVQRAFRGDL